MGEDTVNISIQTNPQIAINLICNTCVCVVMLINPDRQGERSTLGVEHLFGDVSDAGQ